MSYMIVLFFYFPVSIAMSEVPTKRFTFKCFRPVEDQRPHRDPIVIMMARQATGYIHLPPPRDRSVMTARDILYNDLRKFLQDNGAGFPADVAVTLGDEFLKHLTYAIFPLSRNVWKSLNDKHNRGGEAPSPEFEIFFGRKCLGHKADRPCMTTVVQHLHDLWIGMGTVLKKGNWPEFSIKIKHLSHLIQKYAQRITSQAERQMNLISTAQPARTIETASNVAVIEPLPFHANLNHNLYNLNMALMDQDVYVRIDVNKFMKTFLVWQRRVCQYLFNMDEFCDAFIKLFYVITVATDFIDVSVVVAFAGVVHIYKTVSMLHPYDQKPRRPSSIHTILPLILILSFTVLRKKTFLRRGGRKEGGHRKLFIKSKRPN